MAMLRGEPESARFRDLILGTNAPMMSAGSWIELAAVLKRPGDDRTRALLDAAMTAMNLTIVPVTVSQAQTGHAAYLRFGKGRHAARLNFGDCFAYALAMETGLPLLFKGDDFSKTDVLRAA